MKITLALLLLATLAVGIANGSSSGAPAIACASMTPNHGSQSSAPFPLLIQPASTSISSSQTLAIRLSTTSADQTFKGFLLMARTAGSADTTPIGSFLSVDNGGRTSDCAPGVKTAVTHGNNDVKSEVNAVWQPPAGYSGTVTFWATFCQSFTTWWANNTSVDVVVTP